MSELNPAINFDTLTDLPKQESLQDVIRRGILMKNFRASINGDKIYVNFGDESHMYPRPDDAAIERIVAAFAPPRQEIEVDMTNLPLDEAAMDG